MDLRAKAQQTMEEVRKALKHCIREGKPPRSGSADKSVGTPGIPKEVKVEVNIKKRVQQELCQTMQNTSVQHVDDCIDRNPKL